MKKRYKSVLGLSILLVLAFATQGMAHTFSDANRHSVDNGEIRWGTSHGTTKYTSERDNAIDEWHSQGVIDILPDTAFVIEDLSFTDYSAQDGFGGTWVLLLDYHVQKKTVYLVLILTNILSKGEVWAAYRPYLPNVSILSKLLSLYPYYTSFPTVATS